MFPFAAPVFFLPHAQPFQSSCVLIGRIHSVGSALFLNRLRPNQGPAMSLSSGFSACLSRLLGAVVAALCSTSVCLAAAAVCSQLESQLSSMSNSGGGYQQYSDAANRQRNELAMAQGAAQQAGCFGGFLFFMPQPSPRCGALLANIDRMQANLSRLQQARDQNAGYGNSAASRMRV